MDYKKHITPEKFNKLPLKEKYFYIPFYKKYRKVRKKSYCEECGHFTGYYYKEIGIGKPIGYKYSHIQGYWLPQMIKSLMKPSIFTKLNERIKKNNS